MSPLANMSTFQEPTSYNHAKTDIHWVNAMQQEFNALETNDT